MKRVLVICLRYAPGNWQHMKSFAACMQEQGWGVAFVISRKFKWMNTEFSDVAHYATLSKSVLSMIWDILSFVAYKWVILLRQLRKYNPDTTLFVMWHPLNSVLAKIVRKVSPHGQILVWLHEPCKVDKSSYKEKALAYGIIEYIQQILLPLTDIVILHSNRALAAFRFRYPDYAGETKTIPLLFRDEYNDVSSDSRVFDITFVGNAAKSKGIDMFFDLARKNQELNLGLRLQIVTSSRIDAYLNQLPRYDSALLEVVNKPHISDEVIRNACARSFTICAFYKEITQSGVVPIAFMCGTAVIATNIEGLKEVISDNYNGCFLPEEFSYKDVLSALTDVKCNFCTVSKNARTSFKKTWSDINFEKHYGYYLSFGTHIGESGYASTFIS